MPLNIDLQQILLHMLNFVILFAALYFLLYKPVKKFMDKRNDYFDELSSEAEKEKEEADALKAEYESKMAGAEEEIRALKDQARAEGYKEAEKIKADAQADVDKLLSDAKAKAEFSKQEALRSANDEIRELAKEAAEKLVIEDTSEAYDIFLNSVDNENGENNNDRN